MLLIHGIGAKFPCPICLVPDDMLLEHLADGFTLRTAADTQDILVQASEMPLAKDRHKLIKEHGLRDIEVSICMDLSLTTGGSWRAGSWRLRQQQLA